MDFEPTALQKQLCIESLNRFKAGAGDELQDNPGALYVVLLVFQGSLRALAQVGKAAVRGGTSNCDTMMSDFMVAVAKMPEGTAGSFVLWECLRGYQPRILHELDEESMRTQFRALSEIVNGL